MSDVTGTVTSLDGEYALVRMENAGCGRCHEPGGCGGVNIGKMFCSESQTFRVLNPEKSAVGDHVSVAIADGAVRFGALLAYGVPLLLLLIGAFAGSGVADDFGSIIGAVAGLTLAVPTLWYLHLRNRRNKRFVAYIRSGNRVS